jgi:hypothetical protein
MVAIYISRRNDCVESLAVLVSLNRKVVVNVMVPKPEDAKSMAVTSKVRKRMRGIQLVGILLDAQLTIFLSHIISAQGTHDGMCKRHWKAIHYPNQAKEANDSPPKVTEPPEPEGESVYDGVLPQSISYRPAGLVVGKVKPPELLGKNFDPLDPPAAPEGVGVMPLVGFLKSGARKESAWHRNAERRARGLFQITNLSIQLEPWERQLVCNLLRHSHARREQSIFFVE